MVERTLILIKPDAMKRGLAGTIFSELDGTAETVGARREVTVDIPTREVTQERLERHYARVIEKYGEPVRKDYIPCLTGKPMILAIYSGPTGTKKAIKEKVGNTNPKKAEKGTIRGDYGDDDLELSVKERRAVRNLVHATNYKNPEEYDEEFAVWKDLLHQLKS